MKFEGESKLEGLSVEDTWLFLSDPVSIQETIPGCRLVTKIDREGLGFDELEEMARNRTVEEHPLPVADRETVEERALDQGTTYGVHLEIGVTGLNTTVGAFLNVDERRFPQMTASGNGIIGDYPFEVSTRFRVHEKDRFTEVQWRLEPDVSGSLFEWGSMLASPIFKRVVNRFFNRVEQQFTKNR